MAFNHRLARVRANLEQRVAERSYGIAEADLTPTLSWSKLSFINHMNAWKDGKDIGSATRDGRSRAAPGGVRAGSDEFWTREKSTVI